MQAGRQRPQICCLWHPMSPRAHCPQLFPSRHGNWLLGSVRLETQCGLSRRRRICLAALCVPSVRVGACSCRLVGLAHLRRLCIGHPHSGLDLAVARVGEGRVVNRWKGGRRDHPARDPRGSQRWFPESRSCHFADKFHICCFICDKVNERSRRERLFTRNIQARLSGAGQSCFVCCYTTMMVELGRESNPMHSPCIGLLCCTALVSPGWTISVCYLGLRGRLRADQSGLLP